MPKAKSVPFAAVPVIVTWPVPVAEMLGEYHSKMPMEFVRVPHEVPLTVIEHELVVTVDPLIYIPEARSVPFPLMPVIVTQPKPPASTLDDNRLAPAQAVFNPPRPSIVIFPLVVFTFTPDPLMQTPSNIPV